MKASGRTGSNILSEKEIRLYRSLYLFASIATPFFSYFWIRFHPRPRSFIVFSAVLTVYYLVIYFVSMANIYVRQRVHYFLYGACFITSIFLIYLGYEFKFSEGYSLMLLLVIFGIILTFNKLSYLLYYTTSVMLTLFSALFVTYLQTKSTLNIIVGVVFIIYSVIASANLYIRVGSQNALKESYADHQRLLDSLPEGIVVSEGTRVVYANPAIMRMLGLSSREMLESELLLKLVNNCANNEIIPKEGEYEKSMLSADNRSLELSISDIHTTYRGQRAVMSVVQDITERKQAEAKIRHMAYFDSLTGLPNRHNLLNHLESLLQSCNRDGTTAAIVFVDLDRFKLVNDTLGHNFGDLVLQKASERLGGCVSEADFLARYGGDEFVIVSSDVTRDDITTLSKKIIYEFNKPFDINNNDIYITPSMGISLFPSDGNEANTLIKYADTAMYLAKEQGRNTYRFYFSQLNHEVARKMKLENDMRRALENNELVLYYQPLIELNSGRICSAEALIRWQHPEYGLVSPLEFIPLAEETGLIKPIGTWVLESACRQNKLWQEMSLPLIGVSVNVSRSQLKDKGFVNTLTEVIGNTGLEPKYLELEITESILQNTGEIGSILNGLESAGASIAIDDFGVGYSSLSVLQNMKVSSLKIDRSFIRSMTDNRKTTEIISAILDMGRRLDLRVIAEGIENEEQLSILKSIGCRVGQGYLFSRPLPADAFERLLKEEKG